MKDKAHGNCEKCDNYRWDGECQYGRSCIFKEKHDHWEPIEEKKSIDCYDKCGNIINDTTT